MTEREFILVLSWFEASSGSLEKHEISDKIKKLYPGTEPWKWRNGFEAYLRAKKKRKTNPVPPSTKALTTQVDAAKKLYTRFTGHQAEVVGEVDAPEWPEVLNLVGEVFAIEYDTVRDGKYEKYRHEFHKKSRPLFGTSPDGKMLCLIGGSYTFTERGIVDEDSRGKPLE